VIETVNINDFSDDDDALMLSALDQLESQSNVVVTSKIDDMEAMRE
jgi:hypothetical protein